MRKFGIFGLAYVAVAIALLLHYGDQPEQAGSSATVQVEPGDDPHRPAQGADPSGSAGAASVSWFQQMKPYCNAVEVEAQHRRNPPSDSFTDQAHSAACYALAGKIDQSREIIERLDGDEKWKAAGVVFNIGHPVADMGDDLAAGPIMELVVEYWPNHYMALYHAGAANFELGHMDRAHEYLNSFLEHYTPNDGWTGNAERMIQRIENN